MNAEMVLFEIGFDIDKHDTAPDKFLLCVYPLDFWGERRWWSEKKFRRFGDFKADEVFSFL